MTTPFYVVKLNILTLISRRSDADFHFMSSLLNGTLDAPDFLSSINFYVPTYLSRNYSLFNVSSHTTPYGKNQLILKLYT